MSKPDFVFSAKFAKETADKKNLSLKTKRERVERDLAYESLKPLFGIITEQMHKGRYVIESSSWLGRALTDMEKEILAEEKFTVTTHQPEYHDNEFRETVRWSKNKRYLFAQF